MAGFVGRLSGAIRLAPTAYEEVEADRRATGQALAVVLLSSVATGIGMTGFGAAAANIPINVCVALAAWMVWASLTCYIGTGLLPEPATRADIGELLRTTGFATGPGLFRALGLIPVVGAPLFLLASVWMLAAMVLAVRQALDYRSLARAVGVCLLGLGLSLILAMVIGNLFGPTLS